MHHFSTPRWAVMVALTVLTACSEAKTTLDCPPDEVEPDEAFDVVLTIEKPGNNNLFDVTLDWSSGYDVILTFLSVDGEPLEEVQEDELDLLSVGPGTYVITASAPVCEPEFGPGAGDGAIVCRGDMNARTVDLSPGVGESFSSSVCRVEWNLPEE